MTQLNRKQYANLKEIGAKARTLLLDADLPNDLQAAITEAYKKLCGSHNFPVAVRSSATAEDLPQASFAGQHESYLNIEGEQALLNAVKKCYVPQPLSPQNMKNITRSWHYEV